MGSRGRRASRLALTISVLGVVGCVPGGGGGGGSDGDAAPNDAGEGLDVGGADATLPGDASGPEPDAVAALQRHPCALLEAEYAGAGCGAPCPPVVCECEVGAPNHVVCHSRLGCLTALDCEVACDYGLTATLECLGDDFEGCIEDEDCLDGRCVRAAGFADGFCSAGRDQDPCHEAADCQSGTCWQPEEGDAYCLTPQDGSPCRTDDDCGGALCADGACDLSVRVRLSWLSQTELSIELVPRAPAGFTDYVGIVTPPIEDDRASYETVEDCHDLRHNGRYAHANPATADDCHRAPPEGPLVLRSVSAAIGGDGPSAWVAGETTLATPAHTDGDGRVRELGLVVYRYNPAAQLSCAAFATCGDERGCLGYPYRDIGCRPISEIEPAFPPE